MDMKTFEQMLSTYGSDLSRWDGVDVKKVLAFIEQSQDAKAKFDEAQKLDEALAQFQIDEFDAPGLLKDVLHKAEDIEQDRKHSPIWVKGSYVFAAGLAACLALFFVMGGFVHVKTENVQSVQVTQNAVPEEKLETLVSVIEEDAQEAVEMKEVLSWFEVADASNSAEEQNIDDLLDELSEEDTVTDEEDIWDMFYRPDNAEL